MRNTLEKLLRWILTLGSITIGLCILGGICWAIWVGEPLWLIGFALLYLVKRMS